MCTLLFCSLPAMFVSRGPVLLGCRSSAQNSQTGRVLIIERVSTHRPFPVYGVQLAEMYGRLTSIADGEASAVGTTSPA